MLRTEDAMDRSSKNTLRRTYVHIFPVLAIDEQCFGDIKFKAQNTCLGTPENWRIAVEIWRS